MCPHGWFYSNPVTIVTVIYSMYLPIQVELVRSYPGGQGWLTSSIYHSNKKYIVQLSTDLQYNIDQSN